MALLPEELGRTQEQTRTHLPTHDVGPLVAQDRQVTIRLDPVLISIPDDRLRRRTHDQLLLQLGSRIDYYALPLGVILQAIVRHHGALLGEALYVVSLAREERLGDKEREIGILVSRLLEHLIECLVHLLPDGITIGFDHHTAAHGRIFGQAGLHNQVVIPLRVVIIRLGQIFQFLCHILLDYYISNLQRYALVIQDATFGLGMSL